MNIGGVLGNLGRAPVPETEEVARAAWPGRVPVRVSVMAAQAFLPVVALCTIVLLLALWLRLPWLGLVLWTLGALVEWLASGTDSPVVRLLDLVGLSSTALRMPCSRYR